MNAMAALRNFLFRFLIIFLPFALFAYMGLNFEILTKLELALLSLMTVGAPWLFYELLHRHAHQSTATKAMVNFCHSMEKMFSSMSSLEKKTQQAPQEMLSEIRMMQALMSQIAGEKSASVALKKTVNAAPDEPAIPAAAPPSQQPSSTPTKSADVIDMVTPQDAVIEESPEAKQTPPPTREQLLTIIEEALNSDRIEMLVQPIVSLPQRKARHFECFARIREKDGTIYTPEYFMHLAEEGNLIRLLDNAMLFRCIQMTRASVQKKFDVNFFCNISKHTLSDSFFFESLSEFLQSNRDLAKHMIFEFHETAINSHFNLIEPYLRKLKLYNCRFSVDQVTHLDIDIKKLKEFNFKYIKFHSDVLTKTLETEEGRGKIKAFKGRCDQYNIDLILSHVESEENLLQLNDFNFDYGQGFLFGTPVLSKI